MTATIVEVQVQEQLMFQIRRHQLHSTTSAATISNEFPVTILAFVANQRTNSSFHKFTP
jgi:hypothetical protein